MNIKEIALFAWLPFLAADIGGILGGYLCPFHGKLQDVGAEFASRGCGGRRPRPTAS